MEEYVSPKRPSCLCPRCFKTTTAYVHTIDIQANMSVNFSDPKHRTSTLLQVSSCNLSLKQISNFSIAKSLGEASSGVLGPIAAMTRHCYAHEFALKIASLFLPLHNNAHVHCTMAIINNTTHIFSQKSRLVIFTRFVQCSEH